MEITIKIELNEENMKNFADIFWAPLVAKLDEENKNTEEVAPIDLEPKAVEPEDDFAEKYTDKPKKPVYITAKDLGFVDTLCLLVQKNGGDDREVRRVLAFRNCVRTECCTRDMFEAAKDYYDIKELVAKYCHPAPKQDPTRPIKDWSEFPDMLRKRIEDSPLTVEEICKKANVRPTSLHYWQTGEHAPMTYNLYRLCSLFNWDRDYMSGLLENRSK